VLGGTGFIGRHLVACLASEGWRIRVPTRRLARARSLMPLPTVEIFEADIHDPRALESLAQSCSAVINLVGVLHSRAGEPWGPEFEKAHVALVRTIIQACRSQAVSRLLHMSALGAAGASPLPSMYLRSKAQGEQLVRESGLRWTVFRPSVVFGPDDRFLNLFEALQRVAPLVPLARAQTRFQPVYVGDVAQAFAAALVRPETIGRAYDLAGPEVFTLRQLVQLAGRRAGLRRPVIGLPDSLGRLQALLMGALPGPTLMSVDNFDSMRVDNVADGPIAAELGLVPTRITVGSEDPRARRELRLARDRARHSRA
jgi:NADH dehydrogenase